MDFRMKIDESFVKDVIENGGWDKLGIKPALTEETAEVVEEAEVVAEDGDPSATNTLLRSASEALEEAERRGQEAPDRLGRLRAQLLATQGFHAQIFGDPQDALLAFDAALPLA